jgi:elongation factor Ts
MAEITASLVKELRERTGLGMMECKKALTETDGDLQKAEDLLRIKSGSKASKVAGRIAAEGTVSTWISKDGKTGALVEVNCETDFVGKDANFLGFASSVAELAGAKGVTDVVALMGEKLASGNTLEQARQELVMKLGENISVRRAAISANSGEVSTYLHGNKIGVLVSLSGGSEELGKDLAMHIAACKPVALSADHVDASLIERERDIAKARALESGKPEAIVEKIVEGTVQKFLAEVTLYGQSFVKDDKKTVGKLLEENGATVNDFIMFVVGEGLEKRQDDFAAEVAAQTAAAK